MADAHCTIRSAKQARRCVRCKSTAYCSLECQQTDWPLHSHLCKPFTKHLVPPSPNSRRAILFPTRPGSHPTLIWVEIKRNERGWEDHDRPLLDDMLKNSPNETGYIGRGVTMISGNTLRAGPNDHAIELTYRDDVIDESPFNQSVTNITLVDVRNVVDYLAWYREGIGSATDGTGSDTHFARNVVLPSQMGKVKGVRANARGDQVVRGLPLFQTVNVPRRHPLFYYEGDDPSSVTECLAPAVRSVCAKKYAPDPAWKAKDAMSDRFDNPVMDALYMDLNPNSPGWGLRMEEQKADVGSVLVVAWDRGDLSIEDVERIYRFSQDWIRPQIEGYIDGDTAMPSPEAFLKLTAKVFREGVG
ncbi:hypothetical protein H2199_006895 [Coniosporium tulheliwenetii]|uniref:Uncharacterized protein n=1 Tax=Coniosporium tulheliwenetii TaxID=3383036 RepID=A0ACC2YT76_9PEZI|nr:hypothetical protein H2199_006895 [Cladosporium sp. JES 115]